MALKIGSAVESLICLVTKMLSVEMLGALLGRCGFLVHIDAQRFRLRAVNQRGSSDSLALFFRLPLIPYFTGEHCHELQPTDS